MKPKVFVASSVEGLNVAYSMQVNLQHDADLTVWSQGVFSLSITPLDSISEALNSSDFGIFVFSPDDETMMRGHISDTVRDNVIFELGLFVGKLGKRRCFIVMPDNVDLRIPTDLVGVTPAKYSGSRDKSEIAASLGPACHEIRQAMQLQGLCNQQGTESQKIPANDHDNYDEDDKIALLEAWLITEAEEGKAIKYIDIDNYLKIELGSTKKLLTTIFNRNSSFKIDIAGSNVFKFHYDQQFPF
ncbi:nucleotide-binding protein [Halomonas sp. GD1P12]|uniref:nucleotide-binding protein n=1 Tax=Halomonas sp. GD1P12 TaxID=2982691 RepID=UPI0021E36641|nr:nucleotide-binding protein [Halomonas sp. GD1P12]UYG00291.1 nucleotide-binding protein [Halomonas sp. GD1P12]